MRVVYTNGVAPGRRLSFSLLRGGGVGGVDAEVVALFGGVRATLIVLELNDRCEHVTSAPPEVPIGSVQHNTMVLARGEESEILKQWERRNLDASA